MYNIVILGCENSHADNFLNVMKKEGMDDINVIGVYSDDREAAEKLQEKYGVAVMDQYDACVGQVDGVIITARHGDNHYKYAKPYLASGVPMFVDKPITVSKEDAIAFMNEAKKNNVRLCGGSLLAFVDEIQQLKKVVDTQKYGKIQGGNVVSPWSKENEYGGFFFYTQHLVQMITTIFGMDVKKVCAAALGDSVNLIAQYEDFGVTGTYSSQDVGYIADVYGTTGKEGITVFFDGDSFYRYSKVEVDNFYALLKGNPMQESYADLFQPVFILNAIKEAFDSGDTVQVVDAKTVLEDA